MKLMVACITYLMSTMKRRDGSGSNVAMQSTIALDDLDNERNVLDRSPEYIWDGFLFKYPFLTPTGELTIIALPSSVNVSAPRQSFNGRIFPESTLPSRMVGADPVVWIVNGVM